ncbi:MAG TPA: hypothetical protein VFE20_03425 [Thermoleophilia bacterium]|nr:hypothetical protein [Thermoleophilia bacterium]
MKRQTLYLFVLGIALAFASYLFFSLFFGEDAPPYASEIAAALMGSLITVVITMILLNRQSEAELLKERNVKMLEARLDVYTELIKSLGPLIGNRKLEVSDQLTIQLLNQRLSFVAGPEVLQAFNRFAEYYGAVTVDGKITDSERRGLLQLLGELAVKIRYDLASEEDRRRELESFGEERMRELVLSNITILGGKTNEDVFLAMCDEFDRTYFEELFACLEADGITPKMGQKGFSIDRLIHCFPTHGTRYSGIRLLVGKMEEPLREVVEAYLEGAVAARQKLRRTGGSVFVPTAELAVADLCGLIERIHEAVGAEDGRPTS